MGESEDPIYRIICLEKTDFSLGIRGGNVVFALTHPFDRSQHWIKDERHGATIKDSKGEPSFALVNRATGQAIGYSPTSEFVPLVRYNMNSCDESVLWTMSKFVFNGCKASGESVLSRVDDIPVSFNPSGQISLLDLFVPKLEIINYYQWKFENISSTCISLFRPSQHTVKIICQVKVGYNLAIDKDGRTVLLVPSNPKDKYQHWIKEMAYGVPVKDEKGLEAFALVNKATGKAIKHGFGNNYLVQVAPFNRNYMDPSLLWTESSHSSHESTESSHSPHELTESSILSLQFTNWSDPSLLRTESSNVSNGFKQITPQNNIYLAFNIFNEGLGNSPLLGLSNTGSGASQRWKIEDFV